MKQAVIETGGKQYLVAKGDKLNIEKLKASAGDSVAFDKVLLTSDGDAVQLGKPYVAGAKVTGKVLQQVKAEKVVVFKYRNKSRYRRKQGHRQQQTVVQIESIG